MIKQFLTILFIICTGVNSNAQIITTIAGNGTYGYSGDGGLAINAQLDVLDYASVAVDNVGNMYIPMPFKNVIRKVNPAGIITTIGGNGIQGYSGDGGLALNAKIYRPTSCAVDNIGNFYFADQLSSVIRKIDINGIITTISGPFMDMCSGDGLLFSQASMKAISGLAFDQSGNLYISDFGCSKVRKVNTSGIITTIAGNGVDGYSGDGGLATNANLNYPTTVSIDIYGNVYIPDAQILE